MIYPVLTEWENFDLIQTGTSLVLFVHNIPNKGATVSEMLETSAKDLTVEELDAKITAGGKYKAVYELAKDRLTKWKTE
jgi:hypothetical protein